MTDYRVSVEKGGLRAEVEVKAENPHEATARTVAAYDPDDVLSIWEEGHDA